MVEQKLIKPSNKNITQVNKHFVNRIIGCYGFKQEKQEAAELFYLNEEQGRQEENKTNNKVNQYRYEYEHNTYRTLNFIQNIVHKYTSLFNQENNLSVLKGDKVYSYQFYQSFNKLSLNKLDTLLSKLEKETLISKCVKNRLIINGANQKDNLLVNILNKVQMLQSKEVSQHQVSQITKNNSINNNVQRLQNKQVSRKQLSQITESNSIKQIIESKLLINEIEINKNSIVHKNIIMNKNSSLNKWEEQKEVSIDKKLKESLLINKTNDKQNRLENNQIRIESLISKHVKNRLTINEKNHKDIALENHKIRETFVSSVIKDNLFINILNKAYMLQSKEVSQNQVSQITKSNSINNTVERLQNKQVSLKQLSQITEGSIINKIIESTLLISKVEINKNIIVHKNSIVHKNIIMSKNSSLNKWEEQKEVSIDKKLKESLLINKTNDKQNRLENNQIIIESLISKHVKNRLTINEKNHKDIALENHKTRETFVSSVIKDNLFINILNKAYMLQSKEVSQNQVSQITKSNSINNTVERLQNKQVSLKQLSQITEGSIINKIIESTLLISKVEINKNIIVHKNSIVHKNIIMSKNSSLNKWEEQKEVSIDKKLKESLLINKTNDKQNRLENNQITIESLISKHVKNRLTINEKNDKDIALENHKIRETFINKIIKDNFFVNILNNKAHMLQSKEVSQNQISRNQLRKITESKILNKLIGSKLLINKIETNKEIIINKKNIINKIIKSNQLINKMELRKIELNKKIITNKNSSLSKLEKQQEISIIKRNRITNEVDLLETKEQALLVHQKKELKLEEAHKDKSEEDIAFKSVTKKVKTTQEVIQEIREKDSFKQFTLQQVADKVYTQIVEKLRIEKFKREI